MSKDLFTQRNPLDVICEVPDKIISVYSLEQHVWADAHSDAARKARKPELTTIDEFQLDPVRPFLTDILRNIAAPWKQERRDNPIGQGYWIQAEFGSGKSHLLCCLSALALGRKEAWDIVKKKEEVAGRGKRESLYRFWEEGIEAKSGKGSRGIFVVVKTLVGSGGGTIGLNEKGRPLAEYILEAVKEQIFTELGKNISLYPTELLADRFVSEDMERYRKDLGKFLRDPGYFDEDEFEDVDEFIRTIQQNMTPEYKRSCGNKLWRFYTDYLKVQPRIEAETEDILKHMTETILAEGYSGLLLVLDEVSLFMKNRDEDKRVEDEKTLVVLSNRLAKRHNLPIWTVCAAQQAIESKMGVKNIIADDRLKLVKLLEEDKDYYDIVLSRVRKIRQPDHIGAYYLHYRKGFTWPNSIGETEFRHFFPFHKPAVEVLRAITYELTTARSAIHFMHQTLKHQIKAGGSALISLWELFDETVYYEEDPSGVHAGLVAIKTKCEADYHAYETCKRQIDALTKGYLKVNRDKGVKVIQTLFLYHIAKTRQQGITSEEIANSVLIERDAEANPEENNQHYETLAENLKKELRQIVQNFDDDKKPRFRFEPVITGVDPRAEFGKARDEAEANKATQQEAWRRLLEMDEWKVNTRQITLDLSGGVRSIFREIASSDSPIVILWQGRWVSGGVGMRDFVRMASENRMLPAVESDQTGDDFTICVSMYPASEDVIMRLLGWRKDPRVILWTPAELTQEERDRLINFAAYRKLVSDWQGKETEDARAVINWVASALETELGIIQKIVDNSYARGRIDAWGNTNMPFTVAGELSAILTPQVGRILAGAYVSKDITFAPPFEFRSEEGIKVINGIVKTGSIPKGAKPGKDIDAAQNFGYALKIMKPGVDKKLDVSDNVYVQDMWGFIDEKLADNGQSMKMETLYKNFMGMGGPKDYGLTRRMVEIFLLCLVRDGRVRVLLSPKSGLSALTLEYSNLSEVVFSAKILDAMIEVQKTARPENWDILRPYAEKLLNREIPVNQNDTEIAACRAELKNLFHEGKDKSERVASRARDLFEELKMPNPYGKELEQIVRLFSVDIETGDDIHFVLYSLKEAFGYKAFDGNAASLSEVDDLAVRLKNYRDVQEFMQYEVDIRTACKYCGITLAEKPDLSSAAKAISSVKTRLGNLKEYIDSDIVRLKTELVGNASNAFAEKGTIAAMIHEYSIVYLTVHEAALNRIETARKRINDMMDGEIMRSIAALDGINALHSADYEDLIAKIGQYKDSIFECQSSSRAAVESSLRSSPIHDCGLTFANAEELAAEAEKTAHDAENMINDALRQKLDVFLNAEVRGRLEQGKDNPLIAALLACATNDDLREYFIRTLQESSELPKLVNRYMKRIIFNKVKIADFKPKNYTIQQDQIAGVAEEFSRFLETQFADTSEGENVLTVLQLE